MLWRIDVEADDVANLGGEVRIVGQLELPELMRPDAVAAPDAMHRTDADRAGRSTAAAVQCVVSPGGSVSVRATTRSTTAVSSGGMREGRVLSTSNPSVPASMKRCCQRQTQVLDVPVTRMISLVPTPSADSSTICARQTCFCGLLRSPAIPTGRARSERLRLMEIPVSMPQTRTALLRRESRSGLFRQMLSTRHPPISLMELQYVPLLRFRHRRSKPTCLAETSRSNTSRTVCSPGVHPRKFTTIRGIRLTGI